MTDKRKIYLSYPYSLIKDKEALMNIVSQIRFRLEKLGYFVFSPLHHSHHYSLDIPTQTHEFWMKQNIAFIECMMNNDGYEKHTIYACEKGHTYDDEPPNKDLICKECEYEIEFVDGEKYYRGKTVWPETFPLKYDSGVIMLLPNIAYKITSEQLKIAWEDIKEDAWIIEAEKEWKRLWESKGCEEEYTICKSKFIQIFNLDAFLEGKEVEL